MIGVATARARCSLRWTPWKDPGSGREALVAGGGVESGSVRRCTSG